MRNIRTRYAPSPTGFLHIGGARTALFCYLFAKHYDGKFIVRIEDTDISRNVQNGEISQLENLAWLGIIPDESPLNPNLKYGKYRQSEKLDCYKKIVEKLLESKKAYIAYDSKEELEKQKEEQKANGVFSFRYDKKWLQISEQEKNRRFADKAYSIRIAIKANTIYKWNDLVRGNIEVNSDDIGDFVIFKSDGFPTYNFAVVVDDIDMEISHVLRGEEHITNTPKQLIIYEALNKNAPQFGHLTIITNMEGRKLSKRDLSLNQFIEDYKNQGYLPEAVFNFLALLGWSSPDTQEILSKDQLIKKFDYKRLSNSPSKFDIKKMDWFSKQYMKNLDNSFIESKINFPDYLNSAWKNVFINTYKSSAVTFSEIEAALKIYLDPNFLADVIINDVTRAFKANYDKTNFSIQTIQKNIDKIAMDLNIKGKKLFMPIRISFTGQEHGPELAIAIYLFGQKSLEKRLELIK